MQTHGNDATAYELIEILRQMDEGDREHTIRLMRHLADLRSAAANHGPLTEAERAELDRWHQIGAWLMEFAPNIARAKLAEIEVTIRELQDLGGVGLRHGEWK